MGPLGSGCPRSGRFWLRELRVSQHFSTFYGPSVQTMDIQLGGVWRHSPNESFSSRFLPGLRCPVQDCQEISLITGKKVSHPCTYLTRRASEGSVRHSPRWHAGSYSFFFGAGVICTTSKPWSERPWDRKPYCGGKSTGTRGRAGGSRGACSLEHVAVEPLAGGKRSGDLVSRHDGVLGPDLADPAPDASASWR